MLVTEQNDVPMATVAPSFSKATDNREITIIITLQDLKLDLSQKSKRVAECQER